MCYVLKIRYLCGMETPKAIKRAAAWYLKNFKKAKLAYLGVYKGADAYCVQMPEDMKTGFPPVFLLRDNKVTEVCDTRSLEIISSLF